MQLFMKKMLSGRLFVAAWIIYLASVLRSFIKYFPDRKIISCIIEGFVDGVKGRNGSRVIDIVE